MTKVPSDADIVFFPTQKPGDAQTFAQQLIEQGKKAKVFGGDGSNGPRQFKVAGLVRVELRTGHHRHRGRQGDHRRLEEGQPRQDRGLLRPAELRAAQVTLNAIKQACVKGHGTIKAQRDVLRQIKKVKIKNWILGGSFKLLDEDQRPAEREVLHLPDSVGRLVQARRLDGETERNDRGGSGQPGRPCYRRPLWTHSSSSPSTRLTLGSVYALIALGYTLVYGVLKLLNFAHGDVSWSARSSASASCSCSAARSSPMVPVWLLLVLVTLAAMAGCAVLGVVIERFAYRPFAMRRASRR